MGRFDGGGSWGARQWWGCLVLLVICGLDGGVITGRHSAGEAFAQMPTIPDTTQPGTLEKRFQPPSLPERETPPVEIVPEKEVVPPGARKIVFVLDKIEIVGSTVYQEENFLPFWKALQGHEVSLEDLYAIAQKITAQYRSDGYILSRVIVPPQRISNGVVRLRAVEGFIHRVVIEGKIGGSEEILEQYAKKLSAARPLTANVLERYLLLLKDLPGVTVQSVLRPSPTQAGAADLTIVLGHKFIDVIGVVNNRSNGYVGPVQTLMGAGLNSLLGFYEQGTIRVATTPASFQELVFFDVNANKTIGSEGTRLSLTGAFSWSNPASRKALTGLGVENNSKSFEFGLSHPVMRSRTLNVWLGTSFFFQDNNSNLFNGSVVFIRDRIRLLRMHGILDWLDRIGGLNRIQVGLDQGLNVMDASQSGSAHLSRSDGKSDFTLVRANFSRLQTFASQWSGLVGFIGQYSFDPLLASRQFGIGGAQYVRAYDPSEKLGDSGLAVKMELQFNHSIGHPLIQTYQIYTYYDFGAIWNRGHLPGIPSQKSLDAAGIGVRTTLTRNLSGYIELAKPLAGGVAARGGDANAPRVFFTMTAHF